MNKTTRFIAVFTLVLLMFTTIPVKAQETSNLLPFEDEDLGRNSNAYLPAYGAPSLQAKQEFVNTIIPYAKKANQKYGIPSSAIIGMAIVESGFGTTRVALHANNIFSIKTWGYNPENSWQLKGQPDEDEKAIPVIANYGTNRVVYDESQRRDNWYKLFDSYGEAVDYLASDLLLNSRYRFARDNYLARLKSGWSYEKASNQYLYDIAKAGYTNMSGSYYRNLIAKVMTKWDLYKYDKNGFKDTFGYWAKKEIDFLAEKGWVTGYSDGTFKPNNHLTRAESATIISRFLNLSSTSNPVSFSDVSQDFWAITPITLVAEHEIMNGTGNGAFSPNTNLTRAQMAQVFYNAGFYQVDADRNSHSFSDVSADHWAHAAIETMKKNGIMLGRNDGSFGPDEPITRAQMAVVIYRLTENGYGN